MLGPNFEVHLLKTNDVSENVFIIKVDFIISYGFIDRTASEMTGDRMRGGDTQQRAPDPYSNPGLLQRGQSLCTWHSCSTNTADGCFVITVDRKPNHFILLMKSVTWDRLHAFELCVYAQSHQMVVLLQYL